MKKVFSVLMIAILAACGHVAEKKIEQDIGKQKEVTQREAVDSGREAIVTSNYLTLEQKERLLDLMDDTRVQIESIRLNESKLKSSLFKYIASGEFSDSDIRIYRRKLIDLENQKLNVMFSSLKETRKILGKEIKANPELPEILDLQYMHGYRH